MAKNSFRRRCSFEIMPDANEMQPTENSRLKKYVSYTENFTARWGFQFRSHRSQTFGKSRNNFPASSALLFFFYMGFLEAKKMSSATATRRRVERPKTQSAKVFDGLLISDRVAC